MNSRRKGQVLNFLKKLAGERNWQVDWENVNKWQPGPKQRSFYTFVILPNGKKAFYKYSLHPSLRVNFLRELTFLEYVGRHFPLLVPKIYDSCQEEGACWLLVEALDIKKGVICKGEETKVLKNTWVDWVLAGLVKIQSLPRGDNFPQKLYKYSYHQAYQATLKFYQERIRQRLLVIEKNKNLLQKPFPFEKTRRFIARNKQRIKEAEGGENPLLLQGDFAPNNLYFEPEKAQVKFLDWEWSSLNRNREIAKAFDFANLYLRLWQNREFQEKFLENFLQKKIATTSQIQTAVILQCVNQLHGLFTTGGAGERREYFKKHINRLVESLNIVIS